MAATNHYNKENCVTVSFNADFIAGANVGDLIICRPEIVRKLNLWLLSTEGSKQNLK